MNNKGQTTVLFSLMISVLFLLTIAILEAGRVFLGEVKVTACVHSMRSSVMADYNEQLFETYHLLFMDPTYGTGSEAVVEEKMADYLETSLNGEKGSNLYQFEVEEVALSEKRTILWDDMRLLKEQIADYEMTAGVVHRASTLAKELLGKEVDGAAYETKVNGKELNISGVERKDESEEETSNDEAKEVKDPRETLQEKLKFGILECVVPEKSISKKDYEIKNAPSHTYHEQKRAERNYKFQDITQLNHLLDDARNMETTNALLLHATYGDYVIMHFGNVLHPKDDSPMVSEVEYILKGKSNDYDNVEEVVEDIAWMRMIGNYAYLLTDGDKKSQALILSTTICALTGTEPLIEVVKYLLLACWAYGESLYELELLMSGGEIPYVKTFTTWYTDLESLSAKNSVQDVGSGMSYEDYLLLLLTSKSGNSLNVGYARMLDVIQINLQTKYPNFRIADCVGSMTIQGKVSVNPLFYEAGDEALYDYHFEEAFSYE